MPDGMFGKMAKIQHPPVESASVCEKSRKIAFIYNGANWGTSERLRTVEPLYLKMLPFPSTITILVIDLFVDLFYEKEFLNFPSVEMTTTSTGKSRPLNKMAFFTACCDRRSMVLASAPP